MRNQKSRTSKAEIPLKSEKSRTLHVQVIYPSTSDDMVVMYFYIVLLYRIVTLTVISLYFIVPAGIYQFQHCNSPHHKSRHITPRYCRVAGRETRIDARIDIQWYQLINYLMKTSLVKIFSDRFKDFIF